ncbi:hypothetical protein [Bradyrhizobium sp. JR3.5]
MAISQDSAEKRASTVRAMISCLRNGEERQYHVGLTGYYIEGVFYSASGLSVDRSATPDIAETDKGFICTAMYPPHLLSRNTVEENGITTIDANGRVVELVKVQLEVILEDVWAVAEFIEGIQCDLFVDAEALDSGLKDIGASRH